MKPKEPKNTRLSHTRKRVLFNAYMAMLDMNPMRSLCSVTGDWVFENYRDEVLRRDPKIAPKYIEASWKNLNAWDNELTKTDTHEN
jgi:hypothetical protein